MADEKIIVEVEIDSEDAKKNAEQLNATLLKQRAELAELRKSYKGSERLSKEYAKQELELKNKITQTSRELRVNNKIAVANANSKEALEAQTARLVKESKQLDLATEQGRNEFERLTKVIAENTKTLKQQEFAQENYTRNVGNYKNSIIEASNATGIFSNQINFLTGAKQAATSALKVLTLGFKGLKGAIVATGIGALIIGLTSLVAVLTSTRKGTEFVEKALGAVSGVVSSLVTRFADLGNSIIGVINGTSSLSSVYDNFLAILDPSKTVEAAKAGIELANANIEAENALRKFNFTASQQQNIAEQNRRLRDDETKSLQERLKLNDKVQEAESKRTEAQLKAIEIRRNLVKQEIIQRGEASNEQLKQLNELAIEEQQIQEDNASRTTEVLTERNALIKEAELERVQATKDRIESLLLLEEEGTLERIRLAKQAAEVEKELQITQAETEIKNASALNARKLLIESQYLESLKELKEQEAELLKGIELKGSEEATQITKEGIDDRVTANIQGIEKQIAADERRVEAQAKIQNAVQQQRARELAGYQSFLQAGEALAAEGTAANKLFGIANATISTYQAGAQALSTVPFPANIAALAAVIGTGLAQVANIIGINFAEGGDLSKGGMEGTKQKGKIDNLIGSSPNIPIFRFGGEEFITNKAATRNNKEALSTINAFGSRQKFDVVPKFETGGIVENGVSSAVNAQMNVQRLLSSMPAPVVRVSDINKGFANVNVSQKGGEIG